MFNKEKNYIINIPNPLGGETLDLVGTAATELLELTKLNLPIPNAFVLSSLAFDDFITSADLIDQVSQILSTVQKRDVFSAEQAANQINALISQANFPSIVINPLLQAYKGLSGFTDKYVAIKPSYILPAELIPENVDMEAKLNVKGEAALLYSIKQVWASLFSKQALLLRAEHNYSGSLSIAVVVQKMVQAESTGKAYSCDPVTFDKSYIQIEGVLGLMDTVEIHPDVYKVDPSDLRIIEKNIVAQEVMMLRRGRATPDENPNIQVTISEEWKRKQKLEDKFITHLAESVRYLKKQLKQEMEIHWALEGGKLYVVSAKPLTETHYAERELHTEVWQELNIPNSIEKLSQPDIADQVVAELSEPSDPDIDSLVLEVNELSKPLPTDEPMDLIEPEILETAKMEPEAPQKNEEPEIELTASNMPRFEMPDFDRSQIKTRIYIDISNMDSSLMSQAKEFSGAYLDGTQTVIRQKTLPEDVVNDRAQLSSLIETYALEISTAAKIVAPNPLIYSLSNIDATVRKQMDRKDDRNLADGIERFIIKPESMLAELLAVKRAKTVYGANNIDVVLPKIRMVDQIVEVKKILGSQSINRGSNLHILAELQTPSFAYNAKELDKTVIDGILVNYFALGKALLERDPNSDRDASIINDAVKSMQSQVDVKDMRYLLLIPNSPMLAEKILKETSGWDTIIFNTIPSVESLQKIKDLESSDIQGLGPKKRGRKPKSL